MEITKDIRYIGVNDHKIDLFEGQYSVPNGISYNSYAIVDERTAVTDTVDARFLHDWLDNMAKEIGRDGPDYLIVSHMEPDHAASIEAFVNQYPNVTVVGNKFTKKIISHYYGEDFAFLEVKDGDELILGHHRLQFVFTPMVHWPESMMAYDMTEQILFSQDAFGSFGTLDGNIFDDEIDLVAYENEMRRYYANIVGKYSQHVGKALA